MTDATDVRPVAAVLPHVVQEQVAQVEGLATGAADELLVFGMALFVRSQRAGAAEALQTDLTAEGFDSARPPPPHRSSPRLSLLVVVDELLVLLQLTVVEERLPTQVAHERLLHTVNQHVSLQSPRTCEALATLITPERTEETTC